MMNLKMSMKNGQLTCAFVACLLLSGALTQCLSGWKYWNHRCYWVDETLLTRDQSIAYCQNFSATLAVPSSVAEQHFIASIAANASIKWFYLGCTTKLAGKNSSEWFCNDGSSLGTYDLGNFIYQTGVNHFWDPGNVRYKGDEELMIWSASGLWRDTLFTRARGFICEYAIGRETGGTGDSASHNIIQKNTRVTFPSPNTTVTGVWSRLLCVSECLSHLFCIAVNFDANASTCHVFMETLWVFQVTNTAGWEFMEMYD